MAAFPVVRWRDQQCSVCWQILMRAVSSWWWCKKIDRLTHFLADCAQLVERFDAAGCSFVSVTQAFNTASSMGRLTLNVLLSFAPFDREVTVERIRDKIAVSEKKGMWMGGVPPLGYDPHLNPKVPGLLINQTEAKNGSGSLRDVHCPLSTAA